MWWEPRFINARAGQAVARKYVVCGTLRPSVLYRGRASALLITNNSRCGRWAKKSAAFVCDRRPTGDQAFLSTKLWLPLVEDDEAAACAVDELLGLDPDEDTEAGA
jgi:hypothetical protein